MKNCLLKGAITPEFISNSIAKHQSKTAIGAHNIFLGQIRADNKDGKEVKAIDYSAYDSMANKEFHIIRENCFAKYDITCMHIYHSLGRVKSGEICLFVFVSAPHRKITFNALEFVVEAIKEKVPVFGKEVFADNTYVWKENT